MLPQLVRRGARSTRTIDPANCPSGSPLRRSRDLGQAVVEFAIILPIFILLMLMAVDFGRFFFTYVQLNNSAREAVAYAAFNPTTDSATLTAVARGEANVQSQRGPGPMTATSSCVDNTGTPLACIDATGGGGAGNRITVGVTGRFNFFTPIIGAFWAGGLPVTSSATAAIADYAAGGGGAPPTCSTLPPTPTFTWQSPDPVNHPFLISVDAGASTSLASPCQNVGYNWTFGGASIDPSGDDLREGITQDFEYAAAGTYTVTLVVSNAAGDSPAFTRTVTLGTTPCTAPTATFTVSPAAILDKKGNITNWNAANNGGQQATQFTFDGNSSAFMSDPACHPIWSWNLGDGTTPAPTTAVVLHSYAHSQAGKTEHVTLTATNDAGTNTSVPFDIPLN